MKKFLSVCTALAFVVALGLPAIAGEADEVELAGWITDEWCGAKNANKDGEGCAKACAKKGAELVLFSGGKIYKLSDQEAALEHVGHKVVVTGVMNDEETLAVTSIAEIEDDA